MRFESLLALLLAAGALLLPSSALAHRVGLSQGTYSVTGSTVHAELAFARSELVLALPELDRNQDGALDAAELDASQPALNRELIQRMSLRLGREPCSGALRGARLLEGDGLSMAADFRCPGPKTGGSEPLTCELGFLDQLPFGHRHLARFGSASLPREAVLFRNSANFELQGPVSSARSSGFLEFVRLGIEHILTGFDHLVFLLGLLVVGGPWRRLLLLVTAFTAAHSVTLALSALELVELSPSIVEPLIALSIAYIGVENFLIKNVRTRWRTSFAFGLIHGFGFAGALRERGLPHDSVVSGLFGFNLGVEVGQLAIVALLLPALAWAARSPAFQRMAVRAVSVSIIAAGLGWFVQRL